MYIIYKILEISAFLLAFSGFLVYSIQAILFAYSAICEMLCLPVTVTLDQKIVLSKGRIFVLRRNYLRNLRCIFGKFAVAFLAFFWWLGLLIGILICRCVDYSYFSLMRMALCSPVSIISTLTVVFLPLVFTFIFIYTKTDFLVVPLVLFKGLTYGFSLCCISVLFGNAAWLAGMLTQFSGTLSMFLLIGIWLLHFDHRLELNAVKCTLVTLIFLFISIADRWIISVFWTALLEQL